MTPVKWSPARIGVAIALDRVEVGKVLAHDGEGDRIAVVQRVARFRHRALVKRLGAGRGLLRGMHRGVLFRPLRVIQRGLPLGVARLAFLVLLEARLALVDHRVVDGDRRRHATDKAGRLLLGALEFMLLGGQRLRARAHMDLRFAIDTLVGEAALVDTLLAPGALQRAIDLLLPNVAETLGAAGFRRQHNAPAGLNVAVAEDDMGMGIVGVALAGMDRGHPRSPAFGHAFAECMEEFDLLVAAQLERQGHDQLVDDARVLAVILFLRIEPLAGGAVGRHTGAKDDRAGIRAGNVALVKACGAGRMLAPADVAVVQAEDRHVASRTAAKPPVGNAQEFFWSVNFQYAQIHGKRGGPGSGWGSRQVCTHGTARWAGWGELRAQGLLGSSGLLVGFAEPTENGFEPIRYRGDLHQLIIGGTGGGKFTTALAPMLLGSALEGQTVVVVDPKGEIARLTGPFFQSPFAREPSVFLLDPWDQCGTGRTSALNVLADITLANPNYVDDARALADAMIIPSGAENTHWDNAARNFLTSVILFVALDPSEDGRRDLIRVRDLVTLSWAMPKTYKGPKRETLSALLMEHLVSSLAGGAVKRGFASLMNREDKERSGILSSIERDTAWIDSPQMQNVLKGESLDLSRVAGAGHKYYIVLPPDYFMTHRAWLRLMVTAFAKAMKRHRAPQDRPRDARWRHIVIDEFANLGEMSFVLEDVAVARGFDVKYHFAIQDLSQLRRVYQEGWESFINNTFQRFFAVGDLFTADYVSRMLGAATVKSFGSSTAEGIGESWADGSGKSTNTGTNFGSIFSTATHGRSMGESVSHTETVSKNKSETTTTTEVQRPLYTPDEVRRLDADRQILFFRGMHPIWSWRPPYWRMFPSLPRFSLGDVLGTVGRQPQSRAERAYFTGWRRRNLLIKPAGQRRFRIPRFVPGLLRFVTKAAAVVFVIAVAAYGLFSYLSPVPPPRVAAVPSAVSPPSQSPPASLRPTAPQHPTVVSSDGQCVNYSDGTRECKLPMEAAAPTTRDTNNPVNVPSSVNPLADRPIESEPVQRVRPLPVPASQVAAPAQAPTGGPQAAPSTPAAAPTAQAAAPPLQPAASPGTPVDAKPPAPALSPDLLAGLRSAAPDSWREHSFSSQRPTPPNVKQSYVVAGAAESIFPVPPERNPDYTVLTGRHFGPAKTEPAAQPSQAPPVRTGTGEREFSLALDNEDDCAVTLAGRTVPGFSLTCNRVISGVSLGATAVSNPVGSVEECASKCRAVAACAGFSYSLQGSGRGHACSIFGKGGRLDMVVGWVTGRR